MRPFTRIDAVDLAGALAVSAALTVLLMRLLNDDDWPISAVTVGAAVGFIVGGVSRMSPEATRKLGSWAERRRVWKALRKGRAPDGIDRNAWFAALSELPNTGLYRRRCSWVLAACGIAALACLGTVSASFAVHTEIPAFVGPVLSAAIGLAVAAGLMRIIPWYDRDLAAKELQTLRGAS